MVSCKKLAQNLSGYIEGDVNRELCGEIERHLFHCRRCSVLLDNVRKVLVISGDEQTFELPMGYEERLHSFLESRI
jgi:nicotinamide riboside kinase